jgi:cation diffusion facilitator CzcD-associated flavoprotein CzcO
MTAFDTVIVGAGPYGLAAAAHLRAMGRGVRAFGTPLHFWQTQTPVDMALRSPYRGSDIGGPDRSHTLQAYERDSGRELPRPIPVDRFVDYGCWFQRRAVPDLDPSNVRRVSIAGPGLLVELDDGETLRTDRVVVAAGVGEFAHVPNEFAGIDPGSVSHTMHRHDLSEIAGGRVAVVGGGQSALESAALLRELGAEVDLLVRAPMIRWLSESSWKHRNPIASALLYAKPDVGPALASHLVARPRLYTLMSRAAQDRLATRSVRPAGAGWLRPRVDGVRIRTAVVVTEARGEGERVKLTASDGITEVYDHVLLGTGYRVDLAKYAFLDPGVLAEISCDAGYPRLSSTFETSVPGLHILGAPAARRFGPLMRFVAGSGFAARALTRGLSR